MVRGKSRLPSLECLRFAAGESAADGGRALRSRIETLKLERTVCNAVMAPQEYHLLLVEAPDVPAPELRAAVRWRIKDLIGFHIDDAVIDVFELPEQKRAGQARMMYAVAARAQIVQQHVNQIEAAGLHLEVIDIPEMCLRNVASLTEEDVQGTLLLQFTANYGFIVITRQHTLYLARRLDIDATALAAAHERGEETALLDSVVLEIQRSLDYYDSHFAQPPLAALLLAPGEAPLPFLKPHLAQNLTVPVRELEIGKLLNAQDAADELTQARCLTAIGAALRQESLAL